MQRASSLIEPNLPPTHTPSSSGVSRGSPRNGFSLVELSIVLVILGLLTGGILAGQSLIRAAELRAVTGDVMRYKAAYHTFRDQYMAIPGDMNTATRFWGVLAGDGTNAACQDTAATGLPTCNGNGDAQVRTSAVNWSERFRAWQHLANAGLVEGSYTGKTNGASGSFSVVLGGNVPAAKVSNGYWDIVYHGSNPTVWFTATNPLRNCLTVYGNGSFPLMPEEAWNIDAKLDDGSPATGNIFTTLRSYASAPNCTTSDANDAGYDVTNRSKLCILVFSLE